MDDRWLNISQYVLVQNTGRNEFTIAFITHFPFRLAPTRSQVSNGAAVGHKDSDGSNGLWRSHGTHNHVYGSGSDSVQSVSTATRSGTNNSPANPVPCIYRISSSCRITIKSTAGGDAATGKTAATTVFAGKKTQILTGLHLLMVKVLLNCSAVCLTGHTPSPWQPVHTTHPAGFSYTATRHVYTLTTATTKTTDSETTETCRISSDRQHQCPVSVMLTNTAANRREEPGDVIFRLGVYRSGAILIGSYSLSRF